MLDNIKNRFNRDLIEVSWGEIEEIAKGDKAKFERLARKKYLDDQKAAKKREVDLKKAS
jgi:hypothetical protein